MREDVNVTVLKGKKERNLLYTVLRDDHKEEFKPNYHKTLSQCPS